MKWTHCLMTAAVALAACTTDSYDKGEGANSRLRADFAELTVNADKRAVAFVTDDGDSYTLARPVTAKWMETADTTYRTIIYYNKVDNGQTADVEAIGLMTTLRPADPHDYSNQPTDPLDVESAWLTPNGKYINLGLLVKSGRDDEGTEGSHKLGLLCDETQHNSDQTTTACYRLLHDQNQTPEYYTNRQYVSILLPTAQRPDTVRLTINTYGGTEVRSFALH